MRPLKLTSLVLSLCLLLPALLGFVPQGVSAATPTPTAPSGDQPVSDSDGGEKIRVSLNAGSHLLFFPRLGSGTGEIVSGPAPIKGCNLSQKELAMANLLINDPGQQRAELYCNPILTQVARAKATDMAARNYFNHVNPDGYGPNFLVEQAGYELPDFYFQEPGANNIESLAAGFASADVAWDALLSSDSHRMHVLAEDPFFVEQIDFGIGYAYLENSQYDYYWVILTARH